MQYLVLMLVIQTSSLGGNVVLFIQQLTNINLTIISTIFLYLEFSIMLKQRTEIKSIYTCETMEALTQQIHHGPKNDTVFNVGQSNKMSDRPHRRLCALQVTEEKVLTDPRPWTKWNFTGVPKSVTSFKKSSFLYGPSGRLKKVTTRVDEDCKQQQHQTHPDQQNKPI